MPIITEDDLKREDQILRCKMAIYDYVKEQCIPIDLIALFSKLEPYPLLFQFAHMIAFHRMHWEDARRWVIEHRSRILAYADGKIDEWGNLNAEISSAGREADSNDSPSNTGTKIKG